MTSDLVPVEEAIRLHNLALRERAAGRLGNALQAGQAALEIFDRHPDGSPAQVAAALNAVGLIHEELGHYTDAHAAFHRALAILDHNDSILDHNDPQPVQLWTATLAGAARLDRLLGRLDDAERRYLDAIEIAETVFGPSDHHTASLRNQLAIVYKYAARFDEAEALYRRALTAVEATCGPRHPEAAAIWHNLGGLEHARGRFAEGERYARRSVEIREVPISGLLGAVGQPWRAASWTSCTRDLSPSLV
jgi:tetratricopeptide (TPR) repeat protein